MNKSLSLILVALCLSTVSVYAQDYKKFRVGVGLGYALASGEGAKGGILITGEPGYRISDQILVGLRIEAAVIGRGSVDANNSNVDIDVAALGSYAATGQYYFSNNNFRPFVGAGVGIYSLAAVSIDANSGGGTQQDIAAAANKIGFFPRVGFDLNHFTLSLDYNIIGETDNIKNSYIGIRLGGFFGGGRK
jgi:opacity protein-like surface antigen